MSSFSGVVPVRGRGACGVLIVPAFAVQIHNIPPNGTLFYRIIHCISYGVAIVRARRVGVLGMNILYPIHKPLVIEKYTHFIL